MNSFFTRLFLLQNGTAIGCVDPARIETNVNKYFNIQGRSFSEASDAVAENENVIRIQKLYPNDMIAIAVSRYCSKFFVLESSGIWRVHIIKYAQSYFIPYLNALIDFKNCHGLVLDMDNKIPLFISHIESPYHDDKSLDLNSLNHIIHVPIRWPLHPIKPSKNSTLLLTVVESIDGFVHVKQESNGISFLGTIQVYPNGQGNGDCFTISRYFSCYDVPIEFQSVIPLMIRKNEGDNLITIPSIEDLKINKENSVPLSYTMDQVIVIPAGHDEYEKYDVDFFSLSPQFNNSIEDFVRSLNELRIVAESSISISSERKSIDVSNMVFPNFGLPVLVDWTEEILLRLHTDSLPYPIVDCIVGADNSALVLDTKYINHHHNQTVQTYEFDYLEYIPHVQSAGYHVKPIALKMDSFLRQGIRNQTVNAEKKQGNANNENEGYENENSEQYILNVGIFSCFANGNIRAVFDDRTLLYGSSYENTFTSSNPTMTFRITDKNGDFYELNSEFPLQFEYYINLAMKYKEWALLPVDKRPSRFLHHELRW